MKLDEMERSLEQYSKSSVVEDLEIKCDHLRLSLVKIEA